MSVAASKTGKALSALGVGALHVLHQLPTLAALAVIVFFYGAEPTRQWIKIGFDVWKGRL